MSFRRYSRNRRVEHDPESIWQSVLKGLTAIFSDTEYAVSKVAAIGITNQRETAVLGILRRENWCITPSSGSVGEPPMSAKL